MCFVEPLVPRPADAISLNDRVILALRGRLLRGEFRPGERLTELSLAALLEASRTPVRLALERLSHEGLLEPLPNGGFRVRSFTPEDIWDAIEVRGVLEGAAARLAAERLHSSEELEPMRELNRALGDLIPMDLDSFARYLEINTAFHQLLWRQARSEVLLRALEAAVALPFASPGALVFGKAEASAVNASGVIALEHHRAIVEAIEYGEGGRAEALAREHSRISRRNLECALEDRELLSRVPGSALIAPVPPEPED
jgi:GntR family transcriptional regulator of vanillate catabolism